jgi:hypothetical protein
MSGMGRKRRGFLRVGWTCLLLLSSCTTLPEAPAELTPEGYAYHKQTRDVAAHWNLTRGAGRVTAQGYVQSTTPPTILLQSVYVILLGYDDEGREIVRSQAVFTSPSELNVDDPPRDKGTFEVSAALGDLPVTRFDLDVFYLWRPFPDERRRLPWR